MGGNQICSVQKKPVYLAVMVSRMNNKQVYEVRGLVRTTSQHLTTASEKTNKLNRDRNLVVKLVNPCHCDSLSLQISVTAQSACSVKKQTKIDRLVENCSNLEFQLLFKVSNPTFW